MSKKSETEVNVHANHRSRMRKQFLDGNTLTDAQKLEILLYYCYAQKDTRPIAEALLARFGSITNVFNAPFEELTAIKGVGEQGATLLKLILEIAKEYEQPDVNTLRLCDTDAVGKMFVKLYTGVENEQLLALALNSSGRAVACARLMTGSIDALPLHTRGVAEFALRNKASYLVIAHNHPSGYAFPSSDDLTVTVKLYEALEVLGVRLYDHYLIAGNDYISFKNTGFLGDLLED